MSEVLLYGQMYSDSIRQFIEDINETVESNPEAEVTVRVNSPGGEPEYGWGAVAKFAELKNKKLVKNDGQAHSMALFFNCYTEDTECLDVTEFLLHRCAYQPWVENDPNFFTAEVRGNLERINKNLRAAFEGRVDVAKFEAMKGVKVKDIFSIDSRIEVYLTAQEAKKIGLVKRIIPITPSKKAEIDSLMSKIPSIKKAASSEENENKSKTKMDSKTLKTEHLAVYNEIFQAGVEAGKTAEKDRVGAMLTFIDIDPKGVKEAIASGKDMTQTQMAEFSLKAVSAAALKKVEGDNPKTVTTAEPGKEETAEEKEKQAFVANVTKHSQVLSKK